MKRRTKALLLSILLAITLVGSGSVVGQESPRKGSITLTLRDYGGAPWANATVNYTQTTHDFLFMAGMTPPPLSEGSLALDLYEDLMAVGINSAPPFMAWGLLQPLEGTFDWNTIDNFWAPHEMRQLGFTLIGQQMLFFCDSEQCGPWHLPAYLQSKSFEELKQAVADHVSTVVDHYKGVLTYWSINEPSFGFTDFFQLSQAEWIEIVKIAEEAIRTADPEAKVMLNMVPLPCNGCPAGSPLDFLDALVTQAVEFDVIGLEFWTVIAAGAGALDANGYPTMEWISSTLDTYSQFNKPLILMELGVPDVPSPQTQADWLRALYELAFEKPTVAGIDWFFVIDGAFQPRSGLFETVDSPPRPAYYELVDVIAERTTSGTTQSDSEGLVTVEGYAGEYLIEVSDEIQAASFSIHIAEVESLTADLTPGVGGVAELPEVAGTPLETAGSSSPSATVLAGVAVTAGLALGGAAWYARRRRSE